MRNIDPLSIRITDIEENEAIVEPVDLMSCKPALWFGWSRALSSLDCPLEIKLHAWKIDDGNRNMTETMPAEAKVLEWMSTGQTVLGCISGKIYLRGLPPEYEYLGDGSLRYDHDMKCVILKLDAVTSGDDRVIL